MRRMVVYRTILLIWYVFDLSKSFKSTVDLSQILLSFTTFMVQSPFKNSKILDLLQFLIRVDSRLFFHAVLGTSRLLIFDQDGKTTTKKFYAELLKFWFGLISFLKKFFSKVFFNMALKKIFKERSPVDEARRFTIRI